MPWDEKLECSVSTRRYLHCRSIPALTWTLLSPRPKALHYSAGMFSFGVSSSAEQPPNVSISSYLFFRGKKILECLIKFAQFPHFSAALSIEAGYGEIGSSKKGRRRFNQKKATSVNSTRLICLQENYSLRGRRRRGKNSPDPEVKHNYLPHGGNFPFKFWKIHNYRLFGELTRVSGYYQRPWWKFN